MKNQPRNISIPKPCAEKFSTFLPTARGGFCQYCRKEVVDFTKMSQKELFIYISITSGKTCGRFGAHQLGALRPPQPLPRNKYKLWLTALGFTALVTPVSMTKAQQKMEVTATIGSADVHYSQHDKPAAAHKGEGVTLRGRVISATEDYSLPGARIALKGTVIETLADTAGNFSLCVPKDVGPEITLVFHFIGYIPTEKCVRLVGDEQNVGEIALEIEMLGELVVVNRWTPRGMWYRITGLFR